MDMEKGLREIIQVELMYNDGTKNLMFLDAFHIDTQELLELKEAGLARILQRASALLSGHKVLRLSYKDDEGDWCTFNKASMRDALIFASLTHVNDCGVLALRVTTDQTPPAGAGAAGGAGKIADSQPPVAPPTPVQAGAEGQKDDWMLELHVNVICDGCSASPLMGKRFKSLEHDNYDLCETCFHRESRVPNRWVRVQSDKFQKVAACSGPDASAHATWVAQCDGCGVVPIEGPRFRCLDLPDYDLCSSCYSKTLSRPAAGLRFVQMGYPAACVSEQCKPTPEEMEEMEKEDYLESQRLSGDGVDKKTQSAEPPGEIADKSKSIKDLQATIERELSAVSPPLELVRSAVMSMRIATLHDLARLEKPPECLRLPLEAAVIMLNPNLGMPPPWVAVRKVLRDPKLIPNILSFDTETLRDRTCQFIRNWYLKSRCWSKPLVAKAAKAALPFFFFVESQMEFANVLRRLEPLHAELRRLEQQANEDAKKISNSEAQEVPEPVDLEDPPSPTSPPAPPEELRQAPDLEAMSEAALRAAMARLLGDADPSVRSAAAKALHDVRGAPAETQVREADATSTDDTVASTSSAEVATVSTTEACSAASALSARVVSSPPLVLGIEAEECDGLRGDVSDKKPELVGSNGTRQIFRMGHILVPTGTDVPAVPACAKLVIVNDGTLPWPDTAAVAHASGDDMDFHSMQLGSIEPGGGCEVSVELLVPPSAEPKAACSTWAVLDEASGVGLGPLLLFEVEWTEQLAA